MFRWRRMMHRAARRLLATLVLLLLLLLVPPLSLGLPTTDADPYDAGVHGIVLRLLGEDNGQGKAFPYWWFEGWLCGESLVARLKWGGRNRSAPLAI